MSQSTESPTLQDKALTLGAYLNHPDWLQIIGTGLDDGEPCIFAYVNKIRLARASIPNVWHGVPVKIRKVSKLIPV